MKNNLENKLWNLARNKNITEITVTTTGVYATWFDGKLRHCPHLQKLVTLAKSYCPAKGVNLIHNAKGRMILTQDNVVLRKYCYSNYAESEASE